MPEGQYSKLLTFLEKLPEPYSPSTAPFWNDEHISKYMLAAHLDEKGDAASRNHTFIRASVDWLCSLKPGGGHDVLDLGCGPGLYAQMLAQRGYRITGVDVSERSIAYAREQAKVSGYDITYCCQDYLEIEYESEFDMIILIYCDFGVLSPESRAELLKRCKRALRPGGVLVMDVFSAVHGAKFHTGDRVSMENSGFWAGVPHGVIQRNRFYAESGNTLEQYLVVTEHECQCYNIWNQCYTQESLAAELEKAGFETPLFFGDASGKTVDEDDTVICVVAWKS